MRTHVEGAKLHEFAGHRVLIEDQWAHLLWADSEDNGRLLRVRTAERGREYLVRAITYAVSGESEPITNDDATVGTTSPRDLIRRASSAERPASS